MAITVMATVEKTNKVPTKIFALCICFILMPIALAGEWTFTPSVGLTETFTDNVESRQLNQKSSLVSHLIIEANAEYKAKEAFFSFTGAETLASYSHNSDLNDDFQTVDLNGLVSLWSHGPQFIVSTEITNISQNENDNALSDLISGNTVQHRRHTAGFQYNIDNSHHNLSSSLIYNIIDSEDGIGEQQGYDAIISSENGTSSRWIFWQINGQFTNQENNRIKGNSYSIESKIGAVTSFNINPFMRFYDEDLSGELVQAKLNTTASWGPGIQWLIAKHLIIDVSYNYVKDELAKNDDYVAATIDWQPSERTRLNAAYSQRFFGDSYNIDFQHKTKRLQNAISYNEVIEAFDRNSFEEQELGLFWCPISTQTSFTLEDCQAFLQDPSEAPAYQLTSFSNFVPVVNEEFSLNKRLTWASTLSLARTTFSFVASARERETLNTAIIDDYLNVNFTVARQTSAKGELSLRTGFNKNTFDKNNPLGARQEDTYKTISTSYSRNLASSLSTIFTLQFLDRKSSSEDRNYNEVRATLNITKDF